MSSNGPLTDQLAVFRADVLALVSMGVIVTAVVLRGVAVDTELRGEAKHIFSFVRPGVFSAIGVISFAVSLNSFVHLSSDQIDRWLVCLSSQYDVYLQEYRHAYVRQVSYSGLIQAMGNKLTHQILRRDPCFDHDESGSLSTYGSDGVCSLYQ